MADIRIDQERNRLLVRPDNHGEMGVLLKLPSRRWMSRAGIFVVPFTRMNSDVLAKSSAITMSEEVRPSIEERAVASIGNREFPKWYTYKTLPFTQNQADAIRKLYRNDVFAAFLPPGEGKSKIIIDLMTAHFYEQRIGMVVMLCPLTVKSVWEGVELPKHSPIPYTVIDADESFNAMDVKPTQEKLTWVLVSIEALSQGRMFQRINPLFDYYRCGLIVDESSRIKNPTAIRTARAIALRDRAKIAGIATGTPVVKNLIDLYSQFEFLDPDIVGSGDYYAFRNRYAIMGGYKRKEIVGYDNVDELMGLIEPYAFQCEKSSDLPPKVYEERHVTMSPEQLVTYRALARGDVEQVSVKNVLNRFAKAQEVCGGFLRADPTEGVHPTSGRIKKVQGDIIWRLPTGSNPKIHALIEIIEELPPDTKVIIWAKYLEEIEMIVQATAPYGGHVKFVGDLEPQLRGETIKKFQEDAKCRFFIGTQAAGGVGVTLTAASAVIYYSNTFSLEDRIQSEDRAHRHGQKAASVLYFDLVMKKSVDTNIYRALKDKKDFDQYVRERLAAAGENAMNDIMGGL